MVEWSDKEDVLAPLYRAMLVTKLPDGKTARGKLPDPAGLCGCDLPDTHKVPRALCRPFLVVLELEHHKVRLMLVLKMFFVNRTDRDNPLLDLINDRIWFEGFVLAHHLRRFW